MDKTQKPCLILAQLLLTLLAIITHAITAAAGKVPAVIVFGDSSVDAGNNNQIATLLKSDFKPYGRDFFGGTATGRFSNGRIPPDFISEAFGLRPFVPAYLDPSYNMSDFALGVCFASAGTGYDSATSDLLKVIPLWKEVEYYKEYQKRLRDYLGNTEADTIISEALYLISIGTNDFLENYYLLPSRRALYNVDQYQDFLAGIAGNFLREIYRLGARKLSLAGLIPMGCLPLERTANFIGGHGDQCIEKYNEVALSFNRKLNNLVQKLNKELPGIRLVFANPFNIFQQMIQKPSSFGFEVAAVACCATGTFEMSYLCDEHNPLTCPDASKYVFWDAFHPTDKANRIVSDSLIKNELHQFF